MSMETYCRRHGIEHYVQRQPILRIRPAQSHRSEAALKLGYLPIAEKFAALDWLDRYDMVAVMDADFWAAPHAPDLFDFANANAHLGAVVERELPLSDRYAAKLDRYERQMFGPLHGVGLPFFNGGLLVFNRSIRRFIPEPPMEFVRRPELARFIDGVGAWRYSTDQVLWNWFARSTSGLVLQHLDPRLNWLYGMIQPGRERDGWLHHFLLSEHIKGDDPILLIKEPSRRLRV